MAKLLKKLAEWQEAGLLSATQAQAIHAYEEAQPSAARFLWRYGLLGLGLLAIGFGLVAIVASNWAAIPPLVKIGVHVVVNSAVAFALYRLWKIDHHMLWRFEAGLIILSVLTLTLIALIGQILQSQSDLMTAMTLWWLLITPMMLLFGRTRLSFLLWITLTFSVLAHWANGFARNMDFAPQVCFFGLLAALVLVTPVPAWQTHKPGWAEWGWKTALVISAGCLHLLFLASAFPSVHDYAVPLLVVCGLAVSSVVARKIGLKIPVQALDVFMLFQAIVLLLVPYVPGIALYVVYWFVAGIIGVYRDDRRLVSLAITALALRIAIFYFELYRDLMTTGVILIVIGGAVIGLVKTYPRWRSALMARFQGWTA